MRRNLYGGPLYRRQVESDVMFLTYQDGHYRLMQDAYYWVQGEPPLATLKGNMLVPVAYRRDAATVDADTAKHTVD